MKKILMIILTVILLFSVSSMAAQTSDIILRTKYLYFDKDFNGHRILINITINNLDHPRHLTYVEEYYRIDSSGNPAQVNSGRYYDDTISTNFISFEIVRPKKSDSTYSLIKGVILLDNQRTFETWINSSATYKRGANQSNVSSTIKKIRPEVEKRTAPFGVVVAASNVGNGSTDSTDQKTADGRYPLITIIATSIVYMFVRNKRKRE